MASSNYDGLYTVNVTKGATIPRRADFGQLVFIVKDSDVLGRGGKSSVRSYRTYDAVVVDFGSTGETAKAALVFFNNRPGQNFNVANFSSTAIGGRVRGKPFAGNAAGLKAITTPALSVGGATGTVGTNISGLANNATESDIASAIQAIVQTASGFSGVTVTWQSDTKRFRVQYATTRVDPAPLTGNVADYLGLSTGELQTGLATADATAADVMSRVQDVLAVDMVALEDNSTFTDQTLGFGFAQEAGARDYMMLTDTHEEQAFQPSDTTSRLYQAGQQGLQSMVAASRHDSNYVAVMLGAFFAQRNLDGNGVLRNINGWIPTGIVPDELTQSEYDAVIAKHGNIVRDRGANYARIVRSGMSTVSGLSGDNIMGQLWLKKAIGQALGELMTGENWVPLDEIGLQLAIASIENVCEKGKRNKVIAPNGNFSQATVTLLSALTGNTAFPQYTPNGFYVYADAISSLTAEDRRQRQLPDITVAVIQAETATSIRVNVQV